MSRQQQRKLQRRAILQGLLVGIGVVGFGNAIFACKTEETKAPRDTNPDPGRTPDDGEMSDKDEYVPGESPPVVATSEAPKVPNPTWEARAKQLDSEQARLFRGTPFTKASPDPPNRSASHVPNARVADSADGGGDASVDGLKHVIVVVNHAMGQNKLDSGVVDASRPDADASLDAGADAADAADAADTGAAVPPPEHYITTIFLRAKVNDVDTVVGLWEFNSTDPAPPTVSFALPPGVTSVVAYEWCTLHGLWASEPLTI